MNCWCKHVPTGCQLLRMQATLTELMLNSEYDNTDTTDNLLFHSSQINLLDRSTESHGCNHWGVAGGPDPPKFSRSFSMNSVIM